MTHVWRKIDARSGDYSGLNLSAAQVRVIDSIRSALPRFDFYGSGDYEIKQFEIMQADKDPELDALLRSAGSRCSANAVYLHIITGMKNDSGTAAEYYCRKYRHLKIGPRGGISSCGKDRSDFRPVSLFDAMNKEYYH